MLYSLTQSLAYAYSINNNKATAMFDATKCFGRKQNTMLTSFNLCLHDRMEEVAVPLMKPSTIQALLFLSSRWWMSQTSTHSLLVFPTWQVLKKVLLW